MNELMIFNNPEFGNIRTMECDGAPWFVGKDVAAALWYKDATKAARERVDAEDRGVAKMDTPSGQQEMIIINESGLYALVLGSKLPTAQKTLAERDARISALTVENQIMLPKADYFDQLVERNTLMNFRETAKALDVPPKKFVSFLLEKKYIHRDKKGKLLPYEHKNDGLFEVKESVNEKTNWSGAQTLITPKGRETFRLLFLGVA